MAYRRRYRRTPYRSFRSSKKYQYVPFSITFEIPANQLGARHVIVPQSQVAGIRKAKNFYVNFVTNSPEPLLFCLLYAPEGADVSQLTPNVNTSSSEAFVELFAANQWVIGCGSIVSGSVNQFRTRLARNLNNGDTVWLFVWRANGNSTQIVSCNGTGNYAIRYN